MNFLVEGKTKKKIPLSILDLSHLLLDQSSTRKAKNARRAVIGWDSKPDGKTRISGPFAKLKAFMFDMRTVPEIIMLYKESII
ncbi:hypothetical protein RRG08_066152 [Elysia crispata]|uniref:Uncharacterized protein n=1 Tax=Elysia crispata TaxID=231223 RepID=A0AAE1DEG9_9GAST|nr:hypothetical protein RRG08_066152 [Elysia crispata]